jgi:hypothetical protein
MHQRSVSSCNFDSLSSRDLATRGISHKARSHAVALTSLCSLTHSTRSRLAHSAHSRSRLPHSWSVHSLEHSPHMIRSPHLTLPHHSAHSRSLTAHSLTHRCSLTHSLTAAHSLTHRSLTHSLTLRSLTHAPLRSLTHLTSLPIEPKLCSPRINSAQPRLPRTGAFHPASPSFLALAQYTHLLSQHRIEYFPTMFQILL